MKNKSIAVLCLSMISFIFIIVKFNQFNVNEVPSIFYSKVENWIWIVLGISNSIVMYFAIKGCEEK